MKQQRKSSSTEQNKIKYLFVQKDGDDFTCIKLVEDKYLNVVYKYGKVAFAKDEKSDGTLPMKFDYDIIKNPNEVDTNTQEFINYIGDILIELLEKLNIYGGTVVTPNVDHLMRLQKEADFREVYKNADYAVCDSKIVQYASYFLGQPIREKISGSDLFPAFCQYNRNNQNVKIFLLGGKEGVAHQAQIKINNKVTKNIVTTHQKQVVIAANKAEQVI
jgi:hypothetical protein